jgi:biopolymer transport protein ExbD
MTLNLAPMVDVMMCLIIFFLLASKLVDAQHRPLDLPYAQAATEPSRGELGPRVVINVRPSASNPNWAEYVVQGWDGRSITEHHLEPSEIADFLQTRASHAVACNTVLRCVIRADRNVAYGHVEVVLRGCGLAKIGKVVFSARTGEQPEKGA